MGFPFNPGFTAAPAGNVVIGDNIASATITSTTSADLISAATNTGGIIITSICMSIYCDDPGANRTMGLQLKVDGNVIAQIDGFTNGSSLTGPSPALGGGMSALEIPSGQAVSYTTTSDAGYTGRIFITWKAI